MSESAEPPAQDGTPPRGRGRRAKLTPERHAEFVAIMRAGNTFATASKAIGVRETHARWWYDQGAGDDADAPFAAFRLDVDQAEARAESRNVAIVAKAASDGSWQAAAWLLERGYPERWARISQRDRAADVTQASKPSDPFAEVDELAERRRGHGS
jgi:hypothetical protein